MSLNSGAQTQQRSATVAHRGRRNYHHRHHPNQSSSIELGRSKGGDLTSSAATLPRSRSLIKANSESSNSSSNSEETTQQYQIGLVNSRNIRIINNHINNNNNNIIKQPNNELQQQQHNTMHKSVTIVATTQRSNSLDYLNFEEKRQLIASSLSLSELLHCGPAAVKEAAANGKWQVLILIGTCYYYNNLTQICIS